MFGVVVIFVIGSIIKDRYFLLAYVLFESRNGVMYVLVYVKNYGFFKLKEYFIFLVISFFNRLNLYCDSNLDI